MRRFRLAVVGIAFATVLMIAMIEKHAVAQQITIGWTNFGPGMENSLSFVRDDLVPKFEREIGIDVNFVSIDGPALMRGFAEGRGPDVILTWRDLGLSSSWHGFLIPLDSFLARWEEARVIPEWFLRRSHVDHQVYALPFHNNLYGVYVFNKNSFAESGLDPLMSPQSWPQLLEVTQKTTGTNKTGLDMVQWTAEQSFILHLYQNGGSMWSNDFSEILFHGNEGIEALQFMGELYRAAHPLEGDSPSRLTARIPYVQFEDDLINGKLAMFMSYSSNLASFSDVQDIAYFAGRRSPGDPPVVIAEPYGLAISRFSRNPVDAWRFIEWFFEPENTMRFHQATNTLATRLDLADWVEEYSPDFRHLYNYTANAMLQPRLETLSYNWSAHDTDWQNVLSGRLDAKAALTKFGTDLQQRVEALIEH